MKTLICLCVLMNVAILSRGQFFGGMIKQATDVFKQGTDMAMQGAKTAMEAGMQGMNMGMEIFKEATAGTPFAQAVDMAEEMMGTAADYPEMMIDMFKKGAEQASQMAEGAAGQSEKMFMEAVKQVQNLQSQAASPAAYKDLLSQMKGPMGK